MRRMLWMIAIAGCGPSAGAVKAPQGGGGAGDEIVTAPDNPRAEFGVAPGELGDHDIYKRIRHRVRIAKVGTASLSVDGKPVNEPAPKSRFDERPIYAVIGESGAAIQVVADEDNARIAMWIARGDAATTALAPVRVADEHGRADKVSGVTLGAGVDLDAQPAANHLRAIKLHDRVIDASGFVPDTALGEVWVAGEREVYDPNLAKESEPGAVETGSTLAAGPIRIGPHEGAAVIATTKDLTPVRVVAAHGAWTEVELHLTRLRVHGFVPAALVKSPGELEVHGFGHGNGYGMSDTNHIDVPQGVCLYDEAHEIVGVELGPKTRYSHGMREPGWWHVYVGNTWGMVSVLIHDTSNQGAKGQASATWESCAK